jgi:hypothetical protein
VRARRRSGAAPGHPRPTPWRALASWPPGTVARALRTAGLLSLLAGLGSCAGTSPDVPAAGPAGQPAAQRPSHPDPASLYIVAEGVSDAGFEQAETQARAQVAAQVQSELSSVLTTVMSSTSRNGQIDDFQRLVSETATRTSFAHAEMIRSDPAARRFERGVYHAVARLSRAEAANALAHDYELAALDFRAAAADLARPGADLPAWSATLRRAEAGFARLSQAAFGLRAVTRREHQPYVADLALYERAEQDRAARLSVARLGLEVGEGADASPRLAASVGGALARLGLGARPRDCPEGGYLLRLTPEVRWEAGPFGPLCRLTMSGELIACDGRRPLGRVSLAHHEFLGTDVRERARALAVLWEQVDEERLVPLLRHELAPYLPVAVR